MKVMFKATVRGLFTLNTMYCFDAYNWFNSSMTNPDGIWMYSKEKKDKEIFKTIKNS